MQFFIFVLLLCFLIFLFCLYILARDDFVLLKKDVSMERVFNLAFGLGIGSLLVARILFVVLTQDGKFLNPLVFLAFPYFPGLSLIGGVVGGIAIFFLLTRNKTPKARLFDFFSISCLSSLPFGFLGYFLLSNQLLSVEPISIIILYLALFIFCIKILLPKLITGDLKEGTIGLIFLVSFSLISIIENFISRVGGKIYLSVEDLILLMMLVASASVLIIQENLLVKIKKLTKR